MKPVVSPKELAMAIGVSESSLKRWADDGLISASRTAGGHRRIQIGEAIRFIRESKATLVRPDILGLSGIATTRDEITSPDEPAERLYDHLYAGRGIEARGLLLYLYLTGQSVADIADGVIRPTLERLGELWRTDDAGIFIEHRSMDVIAQAVRQLRAIAEPESYEDVALGGAPSGDPYILPTLLAATTLEGEGIQGVNLGPDLPFDALYAGIRRHQPALVWMSVTAVRDARAIEGGIATIAEAAAACGALFVLGGQALRQVRVPAHPCIRVGERMADLVKIAQGLRRSRVQQASPDAGTPA